MFDDPLIARIVAPNLTATVHELSDAQLAAAVRQGIAPDGRSLIVMPAEAFGVMNDDDLGRILAYLKSLPSVPGPARSIAIGPLGRIGLVAGKFKTVAQLVADAVPPAEAAGREATYGRYLARTICAQCHAADLRGAATPDFVSPDLRIVAAYSPEAFTELVRTATALGGRKLGVMGNWARSNLSHLTDAEIAAPYTYLHGFTAQR